MTGVNTLQVNRRKEIMLRNEEKVLTRGFLFACTSNTEEECFNRMLFATEKAYGPIVIRIRKGDLLFLNNIDTDVIYGVFRASTNGLFNMEPGIFNKKYPYQVKGECICDKIKVSNAKKIMTKLGIKRNKPLFKDKLTEFLNVFMTAPSEIELTKSPIGSMDRNLIYEQISDIKNSTVKLDIEEDIPLVEATTFWDFPKQSYGLTPKGNNKYAGVTPALIIYNMVWR